MPDDGNVVVAPNEWPKFTKNSDIFLLARDINSWGKEVAASQVQGMGGSSLNYEIDRWVYALDAFYASFKHYVERGPKDRPGIAPELKPTIPESALVPLTNNTKLDEFIMWSNDMVGTLYRSQSTCLGSGFHGADAERVTAELNDIMTRLESARAYSVDAGKPVDRPETTPTAVRYNRPGGEPGPTERPPSSSPTRYDVPTPDIS